MGNKTTIAEEIEKNVEETPVEEIKAEEEIKEAPVVEEPKKKETPAPSTGKIKVKSKNFTARINGVNYIMPGDIIEADGPSIIDGIECYGHTTNEGIYIKLPAYRFEVVK